MRVDSEQQRDVARVGAAGGLGVRGGPVPRDGTLGCASSAPLVPSTALFVPLAALFVPSTALFVPSTALFVPLAALFVPLTALFVPLTALFVPLAALFVPLPTPTIRAAVRSGGAGRARRRHREGGVPRLRRRVVHGRRPLHSLHALPRRLGTAPLVRVPDQYPRSVLFQNVRA